MSLPGQPELILRNVTFFSSEESNNSYCNFFMRIVHNRSNSIVHLDLKSLQPRAFSNLFIFEFMYTKKTKPENVPKRSNIKYSIF